MPEGKRVAVLHGDQTGEELLQKALQVVDPKLLDVELEFEHFDLSVDKRRETQNQVVHQAAAALREAGFGIKAATVTPGGSGPSWREPGTRSWPPTSATARSACGRGEAATCWARPWR